MNYHEWQALGIENNWCGPAVCYTHDCLPLSLDEEEEMWHGDPCIHIIRLYDTPEHGKEIEDHHPASNWRKE